MAFFPDEVYANKGVTPQQPEAPKQPKPTANQTEAIPQQTQQTAPRVNPQPKATTATEPEPTPEQKPKKQKTEQTEKLEKSSKRSVLYIEEDDEKGEVFKTTVSKKTKQLIDELTDGMNSSAKRRINNAVLQEAFEKYVDLKKRNMLDCMTVPKKLDWFS